MTPTGQAGQLKLTLVGDEGPFTLFDSQHVGGTDSFSFKLDQLPEGQYTTINAEWTNQNITKSDSHDISFMVLGVYRHSQYNSPTESSCPPRDSAAFV